MKVKVKVRFRKICGFISSSGIWGIRIGIIILVLKCSKFVYV